MTNDAKKFRQTLTVPFISAPKRLDQILAKLLPEYSRTQIHKWIEANFITVNGSLTKAKTKVKTGDVIVLDVTLSKPPDWQAQPIPLNIVFEDDALIVVNKPAGLVVHPGAGNVDQTLLNAILHHAPALKNLPRAGIIHRLDKDTSGLLLIAKTPLALKTLTQQLKQRTIIREYQAIVYGRLISGGTISAPIARNPLQRKRMAVVETGKPAMTHYRVVEKYRAHTRLKIKLETGRTHQIRVHMAHIHHPIVGDPTYGGRVKLAKNMSTDFIKVLREFKRQALHAFALGFSHPVLGEWMQFEIALPDDIKQLVALLREDLNQQKR